MLGEAAPVPEGPFPARVSELASYDYHQSSRHQDREAQMATAVEAWEERWATPEGRADWLVPHPAVAVLKARGTQHVLDLGCGVACTHCYSPSTALP
jgi:hypothetical protein